jgi:hypothetical protein
MATVAVDGKTTAQSFPQNVDRGEPCPGCKQQLPVRGNRAGEHLTTWECIACGATLTGVLLKKTATQLVADVRLSQRHFDSSGVPPIPAALRQLVREFAARRKHESPTDERRKAPRVPLQLDVAVVPLNDDWLPYGPPILGMVVDLAPHGLGMITTSSVPSEFVAVQIQHAKGFVQLLGKIAWSKEFGRGFHNSGVQFVLRFGRNAPARVRKEK